jgi:hypothetical protein
VQALHAAGVPADQLATVLPRWKFLHVEGRHAGEELTAAFVDRYPKARNNLARWFLDAPIHQDDATWLLSTMWGAKTAETLDALAPVPGFGVEPA